jgi:hypothetical protein
LVISCFTLFESIIFIAHSQGSGCGSGSNYFVVPDPGYGCRGKKLKYRYKIKVYFSQFYNKKVLCGSVSALDPDSMTVECGCVSLSQLSLNAGFGSVLNQSGFSTLLFLHFCFSVKCAEIFKEHYTGTY